MEKIPSITPDDLKRWLKRATHQKIDLDTELKDRIDKDAIIKSITEEIQLALTTAYCLVKIDSKQATTPQRKPLQDFVETAGPFYSSIGRLDENTKRCLLKNMPNGEDFFDRFFRETGLLGGIGESILQDPQDAGRHEDEKFKRFLSHLYPIYERLPGMNNLKKMTPKNFQGSFFRFVAYCLSHIGKEKTKGAIKEVHHRLNK